MSKDDRTIDDLNDSEYGKYESDNPDYSEWQQQITDNTNEATLNMMFPDGMDDD